MAFEPFQGVHLVARQRLKVGRGCFFYFWAVKAAAPELVHHPLVSFVRRCIFGAPVQWGSIRKVRGVEGLGEIGCTMSS